MLRTTALNLSRNFVRNFNRHLSRLEKYQNEVSSGRKLTRPSDQPSDAMLALGIQSYNASLEQYLRNIEDGQLRLNLAENAMNDIQNLTTRAKDLALMGSNSTLNDSDRENIAIEVNQLLEHLLTLANQKSTDGYLFGGTQTEAAPFDAVRNDQNEIVSVAPHGDISGRLERKISPTTSISVNVDGNGLLYGDKNLFKTLINLRDALRNGDTQAISDAAGELGDLLDSALAKVSEIGSKSQFLEERKSELDAEKLQYLDRLADLRDADLSESLVNLQQEEVAYQAALSVGAEILKTSILEFMK